MSNFNPHNARRNAVYETIVAGRDRDLAALEAKWAEVVGQRDELLEAIELWDDAIGADPSDAATHDEELMDVFRRVRDAVWEGS